MKKRFLYALLVFFLVGCLVSCSKTNTPTPTPEIPVTETETPEVGYNIVFYTFNKTTDPVTLKNKSSIPSDLPVLSVQGYVFEGWYYDVNFTNQAQAGEKVESNIVLYAKFTLQSENDNPTQGGTSTAPDASVTEALKDVVFQSVEETYVKDKTYSITATNIPAGLTVEYVGNNVTGAGNHLVTANFYDANHNLIGSIYAYIKVVYQVEFPEI